MSLCAVLLVLIAYISNNALNNWRWRYIVRVRARRAGVRAVCCCMCQLTQRCHLGIGPAVPQRDARRATRTGGHVYVGRGLGLGKTQDARRPALSRSEWARGRLAWARALVGHGMCDCMRLCVASYAHQEYAVLWKQWVYVGDWAAGFLAAWRARRRRPRPPGRQGSEVD
jgi:hypothetical protein